ncbi:50S ribosomal protein L16 arginine hydroxylase [Aliidiomarina iranensis]|uniref:50S ribosomal protein L16 arginine hydroxylase n=1 Tax=Aliidiomarina iranensis TaxID=1434071 RepID=A0A432W030_9GAMM|nr:cupin domain-containing protein [Aliidiomarina iranensis]RUO22369.1 50S ribosomal protein L16 arginine hydroxylase [Aliidiomarina iranensis]
MSQNLFQDSPGDYVLNHYAFDPVAFLRDFWQKRPVVIRQAFIDFQDPISADELAGLSMEAGVDSRVVSRFAGNWDVEHGPIADFSKLGEENWSLLVQAVNEHYPPAQELLRAFRFLPDWRIDDLMVSYSTPGGGVGPHLDQYDVFIIQGTGSRRWQVGEPGEHVTHCPHPDLKQVAEFSSIIDEVLAPGDMLYIPAGFPHAGDTTHEALNYSVGFRAPSQAELISALADYALEHDELQHRFQDRIDLLLNASKTELADHEPWHLPPEIVAECRNLMLAALNNEQLLHKVCAELFSKNPRPPLPEWPAQPYTASGVLYACQRFEILVKAVGVRMITTTIDEQLFAVVQGHWYPLDSDAEALFGILCDMTDFAETPEIIDYLTSEKARTLLCGMLNEGLFILTNDDESEN